LSEQSTPQGFEQDALPHLNSAYNLARHLTRNDQDAEDIVQEAYLRAFKFYRHFRGGDARPWLLKIVRNTFYTWLQKTPQRQSTGFDHQIVSCDPRFANPEEAVIRNGRGAQLRRALEALPAYCREVLTLRELEELSYKEISIVVGVPEGTVMSRLSRARAHLRQSVADLMSASPERTARENARQRCSHRVEHAQNRAENLPVPTHHETSTRIPR
jgi:RNA polymerase sigma-70 factor (ECF subfamily)